MIWLLIAIVSYAMLGAVTVGDKYLLTSAVPSPVNYTFYVGALGFLVLLLVPFLGFPAPAPSFTLAALLSGAFFVLGLFPLNYGIKKFEASRLLPATGGFIPIITLLLTVTVLPGGRNISELDVIAFVLLVAGSVIITMESGKTVGLKSLSLAALTSVFFAFSFVLAKYVYLYNSFWAGFLWIRIGGGLVALAVLLFSRSLREGIWRSLKSHPTLKAERAMGLFLGNQTLGAAASILQSVAVYLAPAYAIAFINALEGVQYAFLLLYLYILSVELPHLFKEIPSRAVLVQKVAAVVLIAAGAALLTLG